MNFAILGPVEAVNDQGPLPLGGPRQRALLACLLVHANRVVAADTLVEELWASPPQDAHAALQNQVSRLRKVLGDRLVTKPPGYLLRVDDDELDLAQFRSHVAEAGATVDAHERARILREADELFRGAPFVGIDAPFAAAEAAALDELRLAAIEARVDADLERNRHAELVAELTTLVARHPLRERLRGQQILALYRCGRQAEALEAYRETRRLLDEELGLEPSAQLRELERAILRHDPALTQVRVTDAPLPGRPSRNRHATIAIAAVLVALAAAGAGAAVLLRSRPTRQASPAAHIAAAIAAPVAKKRSAAPAAHRRHGTSRRRAPSKQKPARRAHVASKPKTHPAAATSVRTVAVPPVLHATTAVGTTKAPRHAPTTTPKPATNVTPTVTTAAVAPPPSDWREQVDTFSSPTPNWAMWSQNTDGTGASWALDGSRLLFTLDAAGQPGGTYDMLSVSFGTQCRFDGDFDVRVDYTLQSWPAPAGARAQLSAWTPDPPYADVARTSNQWGDSYNGDVGGTYNGFPTSDTHGTLRITRSGDSITAYYLDRGVWDVLNIGSGAGRVMIGLQLFAMASEWTHKTVRVAFDNFTVAAPQITCRF